MQGPIGRTEAPTRGTCPINKPIQKWHLQMGIADIDSLDGIQFAETILTH